MSYKGILVSALISTFTLPLTAHAAFWAPHIGVDYKWWGLEPNEGGLKKNGALFTFSDYEELFPYVDHSFNIYVGTRINGYFGVDFGFEQSDRVQNGKVFDGSELYFAKREVNLDAANVNMRLRDVHLDINFYWEVWRNFELIFMGGLALLHIDTHINHLTSGTWIEYRNESENKAMGRLGIGAQYNILPCLGIKFLVNSEPDGRINDVGFDELDNYYDITPYKTAISYNIGIVYSFSNPRRHHQVDYEDRYYEGD